MSSPADSRSSTPAAAATPAMRQFLDAKRQYPDAIVFFRMGDFYEMFYEDALVAARALELTLTSRAKDSNGGAIPMCGVPYHAVDGYLARLVRKGFRVAICEQVEDPRKAKGLVRREVVRVVSPGTLTDAAYLEAREPAFLMALAPVAAAPPRPSPRTADPAAVSLPIPADPRPDGVQGASPAAARLVGVGAALVDLSTGEFTAAEYSGPAGLQALADELGVLRPREIVIPDDFALDAQLPAVASAGIPTTRVEAWTFEAERARAALLEQLRTASLEGFGLEGRPLAVRAAGGLVRYLRDGQKADLAHVREIAFRQAADALVVDAVTLRHLEVVEASTGGRAGSLLDEIDRTVTAMGGRMLRAWLLRPLLSLERVRDRLDAVEDFAFHTTERAKFREALKAVQDLERLVARVALGSAGPRDLVGLKVSLGVVPRLRHVLSGLQAPLAASLAAALDDVAEVRSLVEAAVVDDPPALAREGGFVRDGFDAELDEARAISRSGKQIIARMEDEERGRTGIASLKVRYNRVFGYYIEVSKANLHAVPADYQRKQTIAGGERFVTPALKEYEEKVLGAEERILAREVEIFERLRAAVAAEAPRIQDTAKQIAALDVLAALAEVATVNNYTKPHVHDADEIVITEGRHPVVERRSRDPFVPNDTLLDGSGHQLIVLTGPNMGGKSTYLRQTALVCLLAQVGSFVPAREAKLALVDRIFARVGASDNIARGQSTFMVEMQETANILHSATSRSLVILDEIGRGTATFDGLSLAWAVAEHLATNSRARPKTIFATHYHELTDLADGIPGVVNCHVDAREWHDEILFLRKVVPGRADRSYGIQVARLAGLPPKVVERAREILSALEHDELARGGRPSLSRTPTEPQQQLGLFQALPSPRAERLVERLLAVDPDHLTPLEALTLLAELRRDAQES
ncbi:MAG: DNA mismatch repair protein MutS [Acidobacteria bacterium]|nr:DNA mismatch repair protein MutS [Acidobacteriota bacterium]